MLNHFYFSINGVMPIFIVLVAGYFLRNGGILDPQSVKKMNALVFNLSLPVMLFRDISRSDFQNALDVPLLIYAAASTLAIFGAAYAFTIYFVPEKETRGAFIQGCFRGNYAIIGLPLIANIVGHNNTGKSAMLTTLIVPLYNMLAVFVLSLNSRDKMDKSNLIKGAALNIIKNPLIIGIVAGIPFSILSIELPDFMNTSIDYISGLATPLALLAIGAVIDMKQRKGKARLALVAAAVKILLTPIVFVALAIFLGVRGEGLAVLFVLFAAPTAVSSYVMADSLGNDSELAASIILLTTMGSAITYALGIFVLKSACFI